MRIAVFGAGSVGGYFGGRLALAGEDEVIFIARGTQLQALRSQGLRVESPKGEKGYYMVSDGTSKPVRWRIRPPSFVNLSAIPKMVEGHLLSDVIAINASIDIVMGEIDR